MTTPAPFYRQIKLSQGLVALVDEADFAWLNQWKWYARYAPLTRSFYATRVHKREDGKIIQIQMHRQILGLEHGDPLRGDHKDSGNTLNNQRFNLRVADLNQNAQNARRRVDNTSGFKCVVFDRETGKWRARISCNGRRIHLGRFCTKQEAHEAHKAAAARLHAAFARTS